MTLSEAEAEYNRLLHEQSTPEELATGYKKLLEGTDKINIKYYPLCDNDNGDDPYP